MSEEDLEFLSDHQESSHPLNAPLDYSINISERVLHLERAHYFLGSRDSDWHLPLLVTIREEGLKNYRQRSAEGWEKQAAKQQKFAEEVKEKKKGKQAQKGKGKSKSKSRASEHTQGKGKGKQRPSPWQGQRRSVYEDPAEDWSAWDSSWKWWPETWTSSSGSWSAGASSAAWFASQWRPARGDAVCAVHMASNVETSIVGSLWPWIAVVFFSIASSALTYIWAKTKFERQHAEKLKEALEAQRQAQTKPKSKPREEGPSQQPSQQTEGPSTESQSRAGEQETEESHSTRTMFVQSQCTYSSLRKVKQPQFEFLRKGEDGAFPGF